jgi:hypothetical protein
MPYAPRPPRKRCTSGGGTAGGAHHGSFGPPGSRDSGGPDTPASRHIAHPPGIPLFFVQARLAGAKRWNTRAISDSESEARTIALRDWGASVAAAGGDLRVISEAELDRHGGMVAVMEAVASFHAEALRESR